MSNPYHPSRSFAAILFPVLAVLCLHPAVSSAAGLMTGLVFGAVFSHPYPDFNKKWIHRFLAWSIIGLGAGANLGVLAKVGLSGIGYTFAGIVFTLTLGLLLGRMMGTPIDLSLLICSGTAICGGSAIAAVSSTLRSKPSDVSSALIVVFLLNSIALLIFPPIGHFLGLDETQFGLWSALAIHDTSSVVGATLRYGPRALEVGTTVKLARALWIIPLALSVGAIRSRASTSSESSGEKRKFKYPWFILGFLLAAALVTWIPELRATGHWVAEVAKRFFVVTLFLIGTGFSRENLKALSAKPLYQAVLLWLVVGTLTLLAISNGLITTNT